MRLTLVLVAVALLAVVREGEGCFWKSNKQATPDWLTKETLNDFNSALDKQQGNRGRRDVSTSAEEGVVVPVTPTPSSDSSASSFWGSLTKGVKDAYNKAKEDAKVIRDRLEDNLGL